MNDTQRSIMERRSTRGFSEELLTREEIQALLDAALAAPTALNTQDWHFTFVTDRALLDRFSDDYRACLIAQNPGSEPGKYERYDVFFHAPLAVFVTLPEHPSTHFSQVDAGIAVENMALSAKGMGLGSVIIGRPREVFAGEKGAAWEREFGFPEGHHFAIGIVVGHNTTTKPAHPIGPDKYHFVG